MIKFKIKQSIFYLVNDTSIGKQPFYSQIPNLTPPNNYGIGVSNTANVPNKRKSPTEKSTNNSEVEVSTTALYQFPEFALTSYLIFMTFAFILTIIVVWNISPKFKWR